MKRNHNRLLKTGLFFQEQKMSEKNSFSCCFAPSDHAEKDNTVPASPSQCGLHWSIFTNRPAYLKPSAAVISPGCAPKTKPDRLRDTLVQRTATKHTTAYLEDSDQEHETWALRAFYEVRPCCLTLVEQGYRKGEGQLPKRVWECVYGCLCTGSITT